MNQVVDSCLVGLNQIGRVFWHYAAGISVQSALLVSVLLIIDWLIRRRVRAVFRHCVWMLVLVKLILPPTLALPTGIGYWLGDRLPGVSPVVDRIPHAVRFEPARQHLTPGSTPSREVPQVRTPPNAAETDAATTPAAPGRTGITWQAVLFLFWLVGVLAFLALLVQRVRFVQGLVAASTPAKDDLLRLLEQCRQIVGVRSNIGLRTSETLPTPAVCGLLQPTILIPGPLVEKLSAEGLRATLTHELAHIKRGDLWVNSVQTFLQVIHFYNPFVWLANSTIRKVCEAAVDETVLVALGGEAKDYSNTLIDIGEMAFRRVDLGLRLIGVAESKKALQWRIRHILTRPVPKSAGIGTIGTVIVLAIAAVLLPMARAEKWDKAGMPVNKGADAQNGGNAAGTTSTEATSSPADGEVIDPCTGLRFTVSKTIAGASDVIENDSGIAMSPNGKFLLWWGQVVPLDGSPVFRLKELKGAGIAAWSPDGQKIAFNSEGIEVLPVSPETGRPTGPVRKLLEDNGNWFLGRICWSADSERVLFIRRWTSRRQWPSQSEREVGSITLRDGHLNRRPDYADFGLLSPDGNTIAFSTLLDGIWTRPVGGGASRLARPRSEGLFDDPAVWTSDSQWVASAVDARKGQEIHFARVSDGENFDVFPPEAVGGLVGKSTDGRKLYFYRSSFDPGVTSIVLPILGGPALDAGPSLRLDYLEAHIWSSDSASLAVLGVDVEGRDQLWSIPLAGGDPVQFNIASLGEEEPSLWSLSPNGEELLYSVWPGTNQEILGRDLYVVPILLKEGRATSPARLVFEGWQAPNPSLNLMRHAWSPDGTKIAMPHRSEQGNGHWILSTDGGQPIQITETPDEVESYPQWSPDGRMIAFYRCGSDREMLQVIPAAGGTARTILTTPKEQFDPFGWSPDSKEVVVAGDQTITSLPISGGTARVIVRLQDSGYESASWLSWSPDGQHLAFYGGKRGEPSRLCLFSPSTGKVEKLENSPDRAREFLWSPDSKMICCTVDKAEKVRSAGVLRELDVEEAVQKAQPVAERKPTEASTAPQVEPIAGPVFTDNFDDGPSTHWRFHDLPDEGLGPGRHAAENGELMLSHARAYLPGIDWADYIVTVRVCMKEVVASGNGCLGIEARAIPSQFKSGRMDRYGLNIICNNHASPYLWLGIGYADGSDTLGHGELSQSSCSFVLDKWYTLEFEVRGQQLRGYLDGKLVIEATDTRLTKGRLWIGTWRARALFDDFSVRLLP